METRVQHTQKPLSLHGREQGKDRKGKAEYGNMVRGKEERDMRKEGEILQIGILGTHKK